MKNNKSGFTIIELLIAITTGVLALAIVSGIVAICYVAFHFLMKVW